MLELGDRIKEFIDAGAQPVTVEEIRSAVRTPPKQMRSITSASLPRVNRYTVGTAILVAAAVVLAIVFVPITSHVGGPQGGRVAASGASPCGVDSVAIGLGQPSGAAGTGLQPVTFRNVGTHACTIAQYPTITVMTNGGARSVVVPRTSLSSSTTPQGHAKSIVVKPHRIDSVLIVSGNMPLGTTPCSVWPAFTVSLSGSTKGTVFNRAISTCTGLTETPLTTGSTGQLHAIPFEAATIPKGWKTYSFQAVKVSVPSDWAVRRNFNCQVRGAPGTLILGQPSPRAGPGRSPINCAEEPVNANFVEISSASDVSVDMKRAHEIHGIRYYVAATAASTTAWVIPSLHLIVTTEGPLRKKVLSTLEPSSTPPPVTSTTPATPCAPGRLAVSFQGGGFATGNDTGILLIRNIGASNCTLSGPASVTALSSALQPMAGITGLGTFQVPPNLELTAHAAAWPRGELPPVGTKAANIVIGGEERDNPSTGALCTPQQEVYPAFWRLDLAGRSWNIANNDPGNPAVTRVFACLGSFNVAIYGESNPASG